MSSVWNYTLCNLFFFFLIAFLEMPFTYRKIHLFKVYNSGIIMVFTELYNHCHSLFWEYFHHPPIHLSFAATPCRVPAPALHILAKFIQVAPTLWLMSLASSLLHSPRGMGDLGCQKSAREFCRTVLHFDGGGNIPLCRTHLFIFVFISIILESGSKKILLRFMSVFCLHLGL